MSIFLYGNWMRLPIITRLKLAEQFGITKTGSVHVIDHTIQSDGYPIESVEKALNLTAIKTYLETEENDMSVLWDMLIDKIEGKTPLAKAEEKIIADLNKAPEEKPVPVVAPIITDNREKDAKTKKSK